MKTISLRKILVRIPNDLVNWIDERRAKNLGSRNSEIVRILRSVSDDSLDSRLAESKYDNSPDR